MCAAKAPVVLVWDFRGFFRFKGGPAALALADFTEKSCAFLTGKIGTRLAYYSVREMISLRGIRELLDETGCLLPPDIHKES